MKICSRCKEAKPISEYYRELLGRDGLRPSCKSCERARAAKARASNPDVHKERVQKSYRKKQAALDDAERARRRKNAKAYYRNNTKKVIALGSLCKKKNRPLYTAMENRRRALKLSATPPWLTAIHKAQIQEFYDLALACTTQTGVFHEVDHVVPLQGQNVRGLHVPWNLQVLTKSENRSKHNKLLEA